MLSSLPQPWIHQRNCFHHCAVVNHHHHNKNIGQPQPEYTRRKVSNFLTRLILYSATPHLIIITTIAFYTLQFTFAFKSIARGNQNRMSTDKMDSEASSSSSATSDLKVSMSTNRSSTYRKRRASTLSHSSSLRRGQCEVCVDTRLNDMEQSIDRTELLEAAMKIKGMRASFGRRVDGGKNPFHSDQGRN